MRVTGGGVCDGGVLLQEDEHLGDTGTAYSAPQWYEALSMLSNPHPIGWRRQECGGYVHTQIHAA